MPKHRSGFLPQPLAARTQRQRSSRHEHPHVMRKSTIVADEVTGEIKIKRQWVPVPPKDYKRVVAASSTCSHGLRNVPPSIVRAQKEK